jgi:hypothetical protein
LKKEDLIKAQILKEGLLLITLSNKKFSGPESQNYAIAKIRQ